MSSAPRASVDTRPPHRLARALVLTGAAVAVGAAAHLLGGADVDPAALALAFPVLLGLSWPLTDRERQVLRLAGDGLGNADIAGRLHLSEGTVRNYLSEATHKLGAGNRIAAARRARERGWL